MSHLPPIDAPAIVGIDPGRTGAYAILRRDGTLVGVGLCPCVKTGGKRVERWDAMAAVLRGVSETAKTVYIEQTQAGPVMGKHATHSLGFNSGLWVGMASALGFATHLVRPQVWQRMMFRGLGNSKGVTKQFAVLAAGRLWPQADQQLSRKCNQGMADALLIAEYGRREWLGGM